MSKQSASNGGEGGIGEARPHRKRSAYGCPISSRIRSFRRTSSHPLLRLRRILCWATPNGGEGGIGEAAPHRKRSACGCPISSRVRSFRRTSSHPLLRLRRILCWATPNGGEGGIRTPGTFSGTTDFESVTFGHSATSPKKWGKKVVSEDFGKPRLRLSHILRFAALLGTAIVS